MKLNGTHQRLIYVKDVNILGVRVHTMKNNTESFMVAGKEIGLAVNSNKTKYVVMFRDQNAGRSRNITIDTCSFQRVEEGKYLGKP